MTTNTRWLDARATLRDYVRHGLYAECEAPPSLVLPRVGGPPALEEDDVYASRPGTDDPKRLDDDGRPRARTSIGLGPHSDDPTGAAAGNVGGWRAYLARELASAPAELTFGRESVLREVDRLGTRAYLAIFDLGHRTVKETAHSRRESVATVKRAGNVALDMLLERLYRATMPSRLAS